MKNKWSPVDVITAIVVITICSVVILATLAPLITGQPVPIEKAEMIKMIVLTLIALVSVYVGKKL